MCLFDLTKFPHEEKEANYIVGPNLANTSDDN